MTAQSKTTIKTYFETGDKPTQAQFIDLIDSYQDTSPSLVTLSSASIGAVGTQILATSTTAAAQAALGGGAVGIQIFQTSTTAAAQSALALGNAATFNIATTAQATTGTATGVLMDPVLTKNAINALTPPSTSGWVPIKTVTASNSTSVNFVNGSGGVVLNGTYKTYAVVIDTLVPVTDGVTLWFRTSTDGGSTYDAGASDYAWGSYTQNSTGTFTGTNGDGADSEIDIAATIGNDSTREHYSGIFYLYNPASTLFCSVTHSGIFMNQSSVPNSVAGHGARLNSDNVDAIQFLMSSGNISSGVFTLYALASAA